MKMIFILLLFFVLCSSKHTCIHDKIRQKTPRSYNDTSRRSLPFRPKLPRLSMEWEPIRILFDTSNLENDLSSSTEKLEYVKSKIIGKAKDWIEKLLLVVRRTTSIVISRPTSWCSKKLSSGKCTEPTVTYCHDSFSLMEIPQEHLTSKEICTSESSCSYVGGGVADIDFIIYVGSKTANCGSGTVAYATACNEDILQGNPIYGLANLCTGYIDPSANDEEIDEYVHTIVHEVFHALGFSSTYFPFYAQPDLLPYLYSVTSSFEENGKSVTKIVTPNSLEASRWHFACDSLNGLEIEDGGGDGTVGSHTEMRIYRGDFMNGLVSKNSKFSPISLSIMEDSGWYKGNYTNAETLFYGKNAGCEFALDKCLSGEKSNPTINGPKFHFCKNSGESSCTADRNGIGVCYMSTFDSIPSYFQYFSNSNVGGYLGEEMDYCPYFSQSMSCKTGTNSDNINGEEYSEDSLCIESTAQKNTEALSEVEPFCLRTECDGNNLKIYLYDGGSGNNGTIICTVNDIDLEVSVNDSVWEGAIICPNVTLYCGEQNYFESVEFSSNLLIYILVGVGAIVFIIIFIAAICVIYCILSSLCRNKRMRGDKEKIMSDDELEDF